MISVIQTRHMPVFAWVRVINHFRLPSTRLLIRGNLQVFRISFQDQGFQDFVVLVCRGVRGIGVHVRC